MSLFITVCFALLLDALFKEPRRFHPLVGFGRIANAIETRLNRPTAGRAAGRGAGIVAWCLAVLPWVGLFSGLAWGLDSLIADQPVLKVLAGGVVLYLAIGWQSLIEHGLAVARPLQQNDIPAARAAVGRIVSRDTSDLAPPAIAAAATESMLENGADAVFAAIFWFAVLGIPGVVGYRLCNTLDAMWGYKNTRFLHFGWAAARMDDVLNFIPARLTALAYVLVGQTALGWKAWRDQAGQWKSPNAGPVMAAGAGAINTALGGGAQYHGEWQVRPLLGPEKGNTPSAASVQQACQLVNRALLLWCAVLLIGGGLF
ncbi:MAG: cobalamin biosynthesis protein [Hahellaceae bacterium]|nr:cobalamin biosynthesis protein [Hahellaceae bacterium]MCP5170169.1 cobalamin biosynthesis protein [Hahellaceae bacterium]